MKKRWPLLWAFLASCPLANVLDRRPWLFGWPWQINLVFFAWFVFLCGFAVRDQGGAAS